jgi:hypothetical protein
VVGTPAGTHLPVGSKPGTLKAPAIQVEVTVLWLAGPISSGGTGSKPPAPSGRTNQAPTTRVPAAG